ncbi:LysR family transcriptional regulator [Ahniella affigens]|uniref:LysR family transcriptional regulator n=1 Tax=Ahniella affigens TaxID=2021234 RepID=A0A2P1PQC8_9GAMM|nr:LysR family transcriptional regulator [Ahniella affigens]AVP97032.1 LysR family transcriptional regulator [Ahniella affigens]
MDFIQLQAFVKVVQTGSFTRAADLLDTQKAHVSRLVSQLERELGVRLLSRSTRALSLTEIGREFFERASVILASVDEATREVQKAQGQPRGTLRLTCGVEFGMIAVSAWIRDYLQQYPDVQVDADFTSRVVDLVHEGFDLAIRVGPLNDSNLAARKLGELRYGLFAAPDYLIRHTPPVAPEDLSAHPTLVFAGGSHHPVWTLSHNGQSQRISLQPRLKANNVFAIRDAAMAAQGIALLPRVVADPAVTKGVLQAVLPLWEAPNVPVHAVFASARYLTPKVRAFIDLAVAQMQGVSEQS